MNRVDASDAGLLHEFFEKLGVTKEVRYSSRSLEIEYNWRTFYLKLEVGGEVRHSEKANCLPNSKITKWGFLVPKKITLQRGATWKENFIEGNIRLINSIVKDKDAKKSFILWKRLVAINKTVGELKFKLRNCMCDYFFRTDKTEYYEPYNKRLLCQEAWLVDKNGDFKKPADITVDELADGYDVTSDSAREVIEFLGFSETPPPPPPPQQILTDEQQRLINTAKRLEEAGFTDDEIEKLISQRLAQKQIVKPPPPQKLSPKKIYQPDDTQPPIEKIHSKTATADDFFKPAIIDYGKKLENAKAKSEAEEEKIKRLAESQQKVLDAEKYSFGWCKALLELEILKSNENKSSSKEVSISFGRVERDPDTQRTLILKYPNRYIPQFMEDLENIPLVLRTAKNKKSPKKVAIEVVGIRHNTLSVKLKDKFKVDDIDLNDVIEARIDVNNPIFLLDELQKQFNALGFADDYNMRDNLCANIEFVFGPPSTGKTTHLADEIISLMNKSDLKILVLTPTNKAADVLVNKIISRAENNSYLDWLLRFGTTDDANVEKNGVFRDKTYDINSKRKNVTITTIARFPYDFFMPPGKKIFLREMKWDYIIIDEASMIMLAQILLPLYTKTPTQFIIAGDPFQIEPVTMIDLWKGENIYTMIELNDFAAPKTRPYDYTVKKLTTQYRSLPAIGKIFSRFAYGGILEHARADSEQSPLNIDDWLDVQTLNIIKFLVEEYESIYRSRYLGGKSSYQIYSALFTFEFVRALRERIDKKISIGIISPYRAQADLIEKLFAPTKCDVQIGTIHTFQGDECDILIAVFNTPPTISGSPEMFLNRLNIINVAISRARDYLFIVMPDDNTDKIENLRLVKKVENLFANEGYGEFSAQDIEELIFDKRNYLEENSFATGHQNVNVYARPERIYEIRTEDNAVDIQLHEKNF